jgi:hypothetical protein
MDACLQNLAFMIDGAPEVAEPAVHLHECLAVRNRAFDSRALLLIPEEAAPQFLDDVAPHNGMMPPPDSEMIAPPITE